MDGLIQTKMEVSGLKEAQDFLKDLEQKVAKKFVRESLKSGAEPILQQAKANVPKKSGELERALRIKTGRPKKKTQVVVQVSAGGNKGMFQGKEFYGGMVEFGFNKVPTIYSALTHRFYSLPRGSQPTTRVEGQHFLQKAAETAAGQAIANFEQKLKEQIEKEKAKPPTTQS